MLRAVSKLVTNMEQVREYQASIMNICCYTFGFVRIVVHHIAFCLESRLFENPGLSRCL
jgi:hypothetical protein